MEKRIISLALVVLIAAAASANAQPFGRNKVRYDTFDFHILETPHFDIYYYSSEREATIEAGRLAERWYERLSRALDHTFTHRQPIVLYASHAHFSETNVIPGFLGDGIGGVTEHEQGRVVLPFAAGLGETDHVLGHELVHAFQRDILRKNGGSIAMLPLWFVEGMAEYLSIGGIDANTAMWLRDAVEQDRLPRIDQLVDPKWFPYRYGQALWAYLADRFGDDVIVKSLKSKASGGAIGRLVAATGVDAAALSKAWHASIRQASKDERPTDRDASTGVVTAGGNGGRLNVGPALSPDGRSLAFLSERDQFSIDVFLADTATGRIQRKIVHTAGDPHFESLQFIESAGAWDPTGRRFALAALSGGQAVLSILDVRTGAIEREIPIREVDQAFSPAWSPDGSRLVFSALKGGISDLYIVELETGAVRQVTADAFADLQPAWSPDGRAIAFSTDRFSSSLDNLTFGNFRLAAIDLDSSAIRELPGLAGAKHIDPHWSRDGSSLYFIADAGGRSNVYRLALPSGDIFQVTSVATGVSGIGALSPALSVAQSANRLAFTVYRRGAYEIRTIDAAGGTPILPMVLSAANLAKALPPAPAPAANGRDDTQAMAVPAAGLLDAKTFIERPYRPGLSLNRIVQPYLSAGGGSTGGFLRAGATLSFGDMLGDHQLMTAFQVGKSLDDLVAQAAYLNRRTRWNWGVAGGQIPWLIGGAVLPTDDTSGGQTVTRQTQVFRQFHRQASALAVYPFSRSKRLELTGGVQSIAFDRRTTSSVYSRTTGQLLTTSTVTTSAAQPVSLLETSAALVYDTALFGATSPIIGQRYRFGVAPTSGDLTFVTLTADYRRYVMPIRPFTIAVRVLHSGRYGPDAEDARLLPLVWTLRDVVRGYGDVGPSASTRYLSASRIVVGNVELRFPAAALFGSRSPQSALPLDAIVFSDVGNLWSPSDLRNSRWRPLRSVGAGVRFNAAGFIFELDAVRPFDRPTNGWTFAFNFRPGF